jgi:hypothetical protein
MHSLKHFIDTPNFISKDDYLYNHKFETLFKSFHNGKNIIYYNANWDNTKKDLLLIFEQLKKYSNSFLFMTNGDVDIPCIKQTWFQQDSIAFDENIQSSIENISLDDFLELDIFSHIPNGCKVYCNSVIKKIHQLNMIPLGRDFKGEHIAPLFGPQKNKTTLCYYNCSIPPKSIHWYGRIRDYIHINFKNKNFIFQENIQPNNGRNINNEMFMNYYLQISNSKFMVCPRGCGLDTYRMWDCLYLGCIPIVVKYEGYSDYTDLPILFVDCWKDYLNLNETYLNDKWSEMLDKNYNYDKIRFSWWINKFKKDIL